MNSLPPFVPENHPVRPSLYAVPPGPRPTRRRFGQRIRDWFGARPAARPGPGQGTDWQFRYRQARARGDHRAASAICRTVLGRRPAATRWWIRLALAESDRGLHMDALDALQQAAVHVVPHEWEALGPAVGRITRRALVAAERTSGLPADRLREAAWRIRRFQTRR